MENNWKTYLINKIEYQISLQEIADYFKIMRKNGLKKEAVKEYLNSLRLTAKTEEIDGRILEILDVVEGFCNEKYNVW